MKKLFTILTLMALIAFQSIPAVADTSFDIYTASDLKNALTSNVKGATWNIHDDIALNDEAPNGFTRAFTIESDVTILGNGHTLSFGKTDQTSALNRSSLITTKGNITIEDLTLVASEKIKEGDPLNAYTAAFISFSGNNKTVALTNVAISLPKNGSGVKTSPNEMFSLTVSGTGNTLLFDSVTLEEARLTLSNNASGTISFVDSHLSQNAVQYKNGPQDEVFNIATNWDANASKWSVTSDSLTSFTFNAAHRYIDEDTADKNYDTASQLERLMALIPSNAKVSFVNGSTDKNGSISITNPTLEVTQGTTLTSQSIIALAGITTSANPVFAANSVQTQSALNVNLTGVNTDVVGTYTVALSQTSSVSVANRTITAAPVNAFVSVKVVPGKQPTPTVDSTISDVINTDSLTVSVPEGAFTAPVTLSFASSSISESALADVKNSLTSILKTSQLELSQSLILNISPLDASGIKLQLLEGNEVAITFSVPSTFDKTKTLVVYHVNSDNTVTALRTEVKDGLLTFYATEFSDFILAELAPSKPDSTLPAAGLDASLSIGYPVSGVGLALMSVAVVLRKRSSKNKI